MIATTAEQRTDQLRHQGVRMALEVLVDGDGWPVALAVLLNSVHEQARINGVRA